MTLGTRTLNISVHNPTLCIDAACIDLQTRVLAGSTLAPLISVTVVIGLAFEWQAQFGRLSAKSIGT